MEEALNKKRLITAGRILSAVAVAIGLAVAPSIGATPSIVAIAKAAPRPVVTESGKIDAPSRTQITLIHPQSGKVWETDNADEPFPALSLVKLLIAEYVYEHGDAKDRDAASQMLRTSNDAIATQVYTRYPGSIRRIANEYQLSNTVGAPHWGNSRTTTSDIASFLAAKHRQDSTGPLMTVLRQAASVAADGYRQDYGTARLPGVQGSKWGWSDDRSSAHFSASFGSDFVVAAATYGSAQQLTNDVLSAFDGELAPGEEVCAACPSDLLSGSLREADDTIARIYGAAVGTGSQLPAAPSLTEAGAPLVSAVRQAVG